MSPSEDRCHDRYQAASRSEPSFRLSSTATDCEYSANPLRPGRFRLCSLYIRYDQRGCGLSDRDVSDLSLDAWVSDLEAVVDSLGLKRFPLFGMSQGGAVAIAYAARHPERCRTWFSPGPMRAVHCAEDEWRSSGSRRKRW